MSKKVIPFPARPTIVDEDNVLWLVAVKPCLRNEYSCEYKSDDNWWHVKVQSKTFAGAMELVEQCRQTLGLNQPVSREAAEV